MSQSRMACPGRVGSVAQKRHPKDEKWKQRPQNGANSLHNLRKKKATKSAVLWKLWCIDLAYFWATFGLPCPQAFDTVLQQFCLLNML